MGTPNYRAIPSVQDHCTDVHETEVSGADSGNLYSTRESTTTEAVIKWTYFLLGCAILLPFNALTNGTSFFLSRLADSPFYSTFSSYSFSAYTWIKLFSMFYCTFTSKQSSPSRRIFVSITTTIFLIASLCLSTFFRGTPPTFFSFALFNAACLGVLCSYLCTAVYARAALLGPSFLQSVLSGQGGIAVAISALQVTSATISLWGLSRGSKLAVSMVTESDGRDYQAEEIAARIFFGVSALFLCITLVAYAWLTRQPSYKLAISAVKQKRRVEDTDELTRLVTSDRRSVPTEANSRIYHVFRKNWAFMFSVAYVFTVTLAVYPAITARVRSVDPTIPPLLFTSVHILVFSIGDLIGRQTCSFPRLAVWSDKKILAMSLLRTIFIPLILLCNIYRPAVVSATSPMINSDVVFMIILFTMGYTQGFVSCSALLTVSSLERNPRLEGCREDVDVAATLGGTCMMVGLASGSLCSFGVEAMI